MSKIKRIILGTIMAGMVSSTVLAYTAAAAQRSHSHNCFDTYDSLEGICISNGQCSTLIGFENQAVYSVKSNYTDNCKYVSCSSFSYSEPNHRYLFRRNRKSGYTNKEIVSTIDTGSLECDETIDKVVYYAELHSGKDKDSDRIERIWITKYRNDALPKI